MNQEEYLLLKKRIKDLLHFDLDNYKTNQMIRRLEGYIARSGAGNVVHYCSMLLNSPDEQNKLMDFLTINVSEFFRDKEYFDELKKNILPDLLRYSRRLNIWSAGCANGAEPYSISIILDQITPFHNHRILATDIDDKSLQTAQKGGPYTLHDLKNVSEQIKQKYFTFSDDAWWISPRIKNTVEFQKHDLLCDKFENGFDLIVCRNVIIYLTESAKKKLRDKFCQALKSHGILFIGATETMLDAEMAGMERVSPCFFRKISNMERDNTLIKNTITGGVRGRP